MEDRSLVDDGDGDGDTADGKVGACTLVRKRLAVLDSIVGDSGVACFVYLNRIVCAFLCRRLLNKVKLSYFGFRMCLIVLQYCIYRVKILK